MSKQGQGHVSEKIMTMKIMKNCKVKFNKKILNEKNQKNKKVKKLQICVSPILLFLDCLINPGQNY